MKKKIIIVCLIVVVIISVVITALVVSRDNNEEENVIGTFDLNDYSDTIEKFKSDKYVNKSTDAESVKAEAEKIWIEIYGDDIIDQRPYKVSFDDENKTWLVEGTIPKNVDGGVAYILIEKDTGKVLAVWHTK